MTVNTFTYPTKTYQKLNNAYERYFYNQEKWEFAGNNSGDISSSALF